MSQDTSAISMRATLAGRWQMPVLVAGLLVFAASLLRMTRDRHEVTFAEQCGFVHQLREARATERASLYIATQIKKPGRSAAERGELMRQLAGIIHDVEAELTSHRPENARAIISNLRTAERNGVALTASDWISLGDACQWAGKISEAADALRQALRNSPTNPDHLRRRIVELNLASAGESDATTEDFALVEEILGGTQAGAADYYWAVCQQVDWLLDRAEWRKGQTVVENAKSRLEGTEEAIALPYLEARCLVQAGLSGQAEALLRRLRDTWTTHDDLWGEAGCLLARIEQEGDRQEMALATYDEVLKSLCTGDLKDACELGRAECLAALNQYEEALSQFRNLSDRIMNRVANSKLDRDAVRATVGSIGESLLAARKIELGASFIELALGWVPAERIPERIHFSSRLADAYAEMARRPALAESQVKSLFLKSAEMSLAVSELSDADDVLSSRALDQAVSSFESASARARMNAALDRYASTHPRGLWRSNALFKLGQSYQADHRYREAAAAYDEVVHNYPRMPDALRSIVPLAECLLQLGGSDGGPQKRGVELLLSVVDDRGTDQLFAPVSGEYREALFQLASYYSRVADSDVPDHLEQAVVRWSDWIALYPDEPRMADAQFHLADAWRRSGLKLREEAGGQQTENNRSTYLTESQKRLANALEGFEKIIAMLAPRNGASMSPVADAHLRAAYLYRADCLFDLNRYQKALEAYREAAWRYEDQPTAVSASLQVVNCHERLGQFADAAAALARARWLLAKVPADSFDPLRGAPSKEYFQAMVDRLERSGLY